MYDNVATLKKEASRTYDEYANETITYTDRIVYVMPRSVYNSEFYNAAQAGLHPSITLFLTNKADYEGETLVEYEGKLYDVIRTDWNAQRDGISLILQETIKNGTE
jgi:SPP1 family predicted phage head-tail adaptor